MIVSPEQFKADVLEIQRRCLEVTMAFAAERGYTLDTEAYERQKSADLDLGVQEILWFGMDRWPDEPDDGGEPVVPVETNVIELKPRRRGVAATLGRQVAAVALGVALIGVPLAAVAGANPFDLDSDGKISYRDIDHVLQGVVHAVATPDSIVTRHVELEGRVLEVDIALSDRPGVLKIVAVRDDNRLHDPTDGDFDIPITETEMILREKIARTPLGKTGPR